MTLKDCDALEYIARDIHGHRVETAFPPPEIPRPPANRNRP